MRATLRGRDEAAQSAAASWNRACFNRERFEVRIAAALAGLAVPAWSVLDYWLEPQWSAAFLRLRLVMPALCLVVLVVSRFTRSLVVVRVSATILAVAVAAVIAPMLPRVAVASYYPYLLGFSLGFWGAGIVFSVPLRYALAMVCGGLALAAAAFVQYPSARSAWDFVGSAFYLVTGTSVAVCVGQIRRRLEYRAFVAANKLVEAHADLEKSYRKLRELDRAKSAFFANVSHELRTPLTVIMAPLGPMIEGRITPIPAAIRGTLLAIQRNGFRLLKRINELLDLARLDEGKIWLRPSKVDLAEFCRDLVESTRPLADQRKLMLVFNSAAQDPTVHIDAKHFEKVVLNLLSNAMKFTPAGGRVSVDVEETATTVLLTVSDTGQGVPPEMQALIFERFFQVDASISRQYQGVGIGLSLAKELVELHGGGIGVESKLGEGARFRVSLPKGEGHIVPDALDRRQRSEPVRRDRRASHGDKGEWKQVVTDSRSLQLSDLCEIDERIEAQVSEARRRENLVLVIDDDRDVLRLVGLLLKDEYDLAFSASGVEGLQAARASEPDLIICDVMMPGLDGYEFCRQLKSDADLRHIPVILLTARAEAAALVQGIDAGADDYLAKPFDAGELKARVRALLRTRKLEAELAQANRHLKVRASDLVARQQALFLSTVKSLVTALEAKDHYTHNHSLRVTEFSLAIGRRLGLGERELRDLELAGLLHDIGKIAVPEHVLAKPDRLTEAEFACVKLHPVKGEDILKPVVELRQVALIVRSHHERYDGAGYPDGLTQQAIPLGARIMGVADAYDAMTSDRPYRRGLPHAVVVKEIARRCGTQFDPEVAEHFLALASEFQAMSQKRDGRPNPEVTDRVG